MKCSHGAKEAWEEEYLFELEEPAEREPMTMSLDIMDKRPLLDQIYEKVKSGELELDEGEIFPSFAQ